MRIELIEEKEQRKQDQLNMFEQIEINMLERDNRFNRTNNNNERTYNDRPNNYKPFNNRSYYNGIYNNRQYSNSWNNQITYYKCNRTGHIARDYKMNLKRKCDRCGRIRHTREYCNSAIERINNLQVESDDDEKIYVTYVTTKLGKTYNNVKRNNHSFMPRQTLTPMKINREEIRVKKTKRKSEIDKTDDYNLLKNLRNTKANITYAQLLKMSNGISQDLKKAMKKPHLQELKNVEKVNKRFKKKYTENDELLNLEEVYELNKNYEMYKEILTEVICNLEEQESEYESDDN
ncbi:7037_t:CDS:1 [Funneliformis geosporum]|uniref:7037_t:CDS:1 n=1 Tax=Funneliformis geosporum TaxID=1117311 RepID=A0A9W4T5E5_9GLOM|nr:7037_t:CDS:1 [Funneliformis geosporum]